MVILSGMTQPLFFRRPRSSPRSAKLLNFTEQSRAVVSLLLPFLISATYQTNGITMMRNAPHGVCVDKSANLLYEMLLLPSSPLISFLSVRLFRKEEKKQRISCDAARDQIYTRRSQPCQTQQHIHSLGLSVDSIQSGTFSFSCLLLCPCTFGILLRSCLHVCSVFCQ